MSISPVKFSRSWRLGPLSRLFAASGLALGVCQAGVPQPPCVYYGQARDEYGNPYVRDAEVILRVEGRVCSRWPILGMLAPGVNFKLPLALDDGVAAPYAGYAAHPGQAIAISVRTLGGERPILETRALAAGQAGDMLGIYVTTGTDANGNGLPDAWEQMLVDNSGGALADISQVQPGDDFDGDGVSNLDEYRARTYAFLSDDFLKVEETVRLANGKLRLRILTAAGTHYQIYAASQAGADALWHPAKMTLGESNAAVPCDAFVGDGNFVSVYVEMTGTIQFYRVVVQ